MNVINRIFSKLTSLKVIIIVIIIAVGWFGVRPVIVGSRQQQIQYQTALAEKGTLITSVTASGTVGYNLEAQQQTSVAWASYLSAKNNLDSAKATIYSLQSALFAANQKFINDAVARNLSTTDPTYIQQNADWKAAEAKYNNQQGVISQAQAALNSASLSYKQLSPTVIPKEKHVVVNLTEIDVVKVKPGQKVTLTLDAHPDKTFTGKVSAVNTNGSVSSGVTTYPATITFDTAVDTIYPNMAVNATIITDIKNSVILVPSGAVQASDGASTVRVMRNGQASPVQVEVGDSNDTQTEIVSGINEGDVVVTGQTGSTTTGSTGATSPFGNTRGGFGGTGGFGGGVQIRR